MADAAETKITAESVLRAYQLVSDAGVRQADGSVVYKGISAHTDPDGYGITLSDGTVQARIMFHNKVALQTPNGRSLARFRKALQVLLVSA